MKKVLIITHYFPPLGMGGVQRVLYFAKYLAEFGWKVHVVAPHPPVYHAYDEHLLDEIPGVTIHRVGIERKRAYKRRMQMQEQEKRLQSTWRQLLLSLYRWINRWIILPDTKRFRLTGMLKETGRVINHFGIKTILISVPPNSLAFLSPILKKKYGVRVVLDLRDCWFEAGQYMLTSGWRYRKMKQYGMNINKNVDGLTTASQFIRNQWTAAFPMPPEKARVIYNGFVNVQTASSSRKEHHTFTFLYIGTITPRTDPGFFLQALSSYIKKNKTAAGRVRFEYYGIVPDDASAVTMFQKAYPEICSDRGYVPHYEIPDIINRSDCLVFTLANTCYPGCISGRLFEFLASGKSIFAVVPEGEAAQLIRTYGRGYVCSPDDPDGIERSLERLLDRQELNRVDPQNAAEKTMQFREQFHRKEGVKKLAELLESLS